MNGLAGIGWPAGIALVFVGAATWPIERLITNDLLPPGTLAAGVLVAAGLLGGIGPAAAIALGALAALPAALPPRLTAAAIVLAAVGLVAVIGHYRRRIRFDVPPARRGDVLALTVVAGLLSALTAILAAAGAAVLGDSVAREAALGAGAGAATLVWMTGVIGLNDGPRRRLLGHPLEASLFVLVLVAGAAPDFATRVPPFLVLGPLFLYAVARFGLPGVACTALIGVGAVISATAHGDGLYAAHDAAAATAIACALCGIITAIALVLAIALYEREDHAERLERLAGALQDGLMELGADGEILAVNAGLAQLLRVPASQLAGQRPPYSFLAPGDEGSPALLRLVERARVAGEADGDCLLRSVGGIERRVACTVLSAPERDRRRRPFTAVFKDVTGVDRRARQHQALAALVARAESEASLERFEQLVVESVAAALGVAAAAVLVAEPPDSLIVAAAGSRLAFDPDRRFFLPASFVTNALAGERLLLVEDVEQPEHAAWGSALEQTGFRGVAVAAIHAGSRFWGVLAAFSEQPGGFRTGDLDFLATVTHLLGEAVTAAELDAVDAATGLLSRSGLLPALERLVAHDGDLALRGATVLAVELDTRSVIDSLGYERAEQVVAGAAQRLLEDFRGATLGRSAADILVLAYPRLGVEQALARAGAVRMALAPPVSVDGHDVVVSTSVGVADAPVVDSAELLNDAVVAARAARRSGAGVELFQPSMRSDAVARLRLESDLRRAVGERAIGVHYQPIVRADDQRVVAFEALARWRRTAPDGSSENVPPSVFVALAEDTDLIRPLGRLVLAQACEQLSEWNQIRGDHELAVTVNLSAEELSWPDLASYVTSVIERTGIRAAQLSLELTETALLRETTATGATLSTLREIGVWLILDDFGTGFASLSMLKRLVPRVVKLDRLFVALGDRIDEAIVAATVEMSAHLGATVVAEGVETPEQLERVRALGCHYIQGYLFAPALASDEATELVRRGDVTGWSPRSSRALS